MAYLSWAKNIYHYHKPFTHTTLIDLLLGMYVYSYTIYSKYI